MPLSFTLHSPTLCLPLPFSLTAYPLSSPLPSTTFPFLSHTLLCLTTHLFLSLLNGEQVTGADYAKCLRELVNICVLCNDSELTYNEVEKYSTIFPDVCLSCMYLDSIHYSMLVHSPLKLEQAIETWHWLILPHSQATVIIIRILRKLKK